MYVDEKEGNALDFFKLYIVAYKKKLRYFKLLKNDAIVDATFADIIKKQTNDASARRSFYERRIRRTDDYEERVSSNQETEKLKRPYLSVFFHVYASFFLLCQLVNTRSGLSHVKKMLRTRIEVALLCYYLVFILY